MFPIFRKNDRMFYVIAQCPDSVSISTKNINIRSNDSGNHHAPAQIRCYSCCLIPPCYGDSAGSELDRRIRLKTIWLYPFSHYLPTIFFLNLLNTNQVSCNKIINHGVRVKKMQYILFLKQLSDHLMVIFFVEIFNTNQVSGNPGSNSRLSWTKSFFCCFIYVNICFKQMIFRSVKEHSQIATTIVYT